jgi:putative transposase
MQSHRRSIRLKEYDYSQPGAYFITIVTFQRQCLFSEIVNGEMQLNEFGKIAGECWRVIPEHFPNVELGAHVVIPNHVHGIIVIHDDERRGTIYRVPTTEKFQNPLLVQFLPSSAHLRRRSRAISDKRTFGSAIITNT